MKYHTISVCGPRYNKKYGCYYIAIKKVDYLSLPEWQVQNLHKIVNKTWRAWCRKRHIRTYYNFLVDRDDYAWGLGLESDKYSIFLMENQTALISRRGGPQAWHTHNNS